MRIEQKSHESLLIKYEKAIEFIKDLVTELNDDDFIFDRSEEIKFKDTGETLFKSEFTCVLTKIKCQELLKELNAE